MNDQTPTSPPANPQTGGAMPIAMNAQYIKDLSFESPDAPAAFLPGEGEPRMEIMVHVQTRPIGERGPEKLFEVTLVLRAEHKRGEKNLYIAELQYAGLFGLPAMPEPMLRQFLLVEAPRLLFPFARSILANVTQDGNFPPLYLQPIDFAQLVREQDQRAAQMKTAGTA